MSLKYSNKLHGKHVLIVGGTSGIGFCVAEASVELGAHVVVASSKEAKVNKAVDRIKTAYPSAAGRIRGCQCDFAKASVEEEIQNLFDLATENGTSKLDHVVNTAGDAFDLVKLADATPQRITQLGTVRFTSGIIFAKVAMRYMNPSAKSSFTMTGGIIHNRPPEGWSISAGYGAGREGLMRGFAQDMRPIRVNLVSPGAVRTEFFDAFGSVEKLLALLDQYKSKTLTDTIGTPEELAESYVYLMKNTFVTGTVLQADGGYLLS